MRTDFDPAWLVAECACVARQPRTLRAQLRERWWRWIGNDHLDAVLGALAERRGRE